MKIIGGRRDVGYLILMTSLALMILTAMALLDESGTNAPDEPRVLGYRRSQKVRWLTCVVAVCAKPG